MKIKAIDWQASSKADDPLTKEDWDYIEQRYGRDAVKWMKDQQRRYKSSGDRLILSYLKAQDAKVKNENPLYLGFYRELDEPAQKTKSMFTYPSLFGAKK